VNSNSSITWTPPDRPIRPCCQPVLCCGQCLFYYSSSLPVFFLCLWRNVVLFGLSCSQDVTASLFKRLECRKVIKPVLKEPLSHTTHGANKDNRLTKNAPHFDEELVFSGTKTKLLCIVRLIGPLEFNRRVIGS